MTKLRDCLRISEAADCLGVSPNALHSGETVRKDRCPPAPMKRYRLFRQQDLDTLLYQVDRPSRRDRNK